MNVPWWLGVAAVGYLFYSFFGRWLNLEHESLRCTATCIPVLPQSAVPCRFKSAVEHDDTPKILGIFFINFVWVRFRILTPVAESCVHSLV